MTAIPVRHGKRVQAGIQGVRGSWLVIEPHFDDACFSMAGTLLRKASEYNGLYILTVFSRTPYSVARHLRSLNRKEAVREVSGIRYEEGWRFAASVGGEALVGGLPEALLRGYRGPNLSPDSKDACTCKEEIIRLLSFLSPAVPVERISFPLGAAHHADHRILSDSVLSFLSSSVRIANPRVVDAFHEFPYAVDNPAAVKARVRQLRAEGLKLCPSYTDITNVMSRKLELVTIFESQLTDETTKIERETSG